MNNNNLVKNIILILILVGIGYSAYSGYKMREAYKSHQKIKEDYAYITKIDFGLFNMKEWRNKALNVFSEQVENFESGDKVLRLTLIFFFYTINNFI